MDTGALRSYVDRSRELVASAPELAERNTQIRLVQPFLTALDWELHRIDADREVPTGEGPVTVDFALLVDDEPAVLVETSACAADLQREQAERLGRTLLATGVDRGILTNGRAFVFLAADDDGVDRVECRLRDLPEHADAVDRYTRETIERHVRDERRRRREAAAALADDREDVVADVNDRLVATAGDGVSDRLRAESERFVDELITAFRDDGCRGRDADGGRDTRAGRDANVGRDAERDADGEASSEPETALDAESERALEAVAETSAGVRSNPDSADAAPANGPDADGLSEVPPDALGAAVAEDGQYVVRLFGDRTSVWAIGHARAAMTAARSIEYVLDRGAVDGRGAPADEVTESLAPPWGPDGEYALFRGDAVENATIELSNGWHLDARVPVGVATAAIERLAERAGLRAMFQGEWPAE